MANYTLDDFGCLRAEFNVIWSVSDNITIESGQGTENIIVNTTADQEAGFIRATIDSGCDELVFTKDVWLGKPLPPTVNKWCFFDEEVIILEITNPQPNVNYQWQVISQHDIESFTGTSIDVDIWDTPAQYVLTATNKCGTVTVSGSIDKSDCVPKGKKLVIYPNPVKEVLQIKIPIKDKIKSITSVKSIRLFDNRMTLSYEKQITSNSFSLSTIGLPTGVYFLQVNDGQQIFAEKIIIQHE